MRRVRIIVSVLLILLGFIFTAELYQNYFQNFCGRFFYFSLEEKEDRGTMAELLEKAADERKRGIFAVTNNTVSTLETEIDIYANDRAIKLLESKYDVTEGEFNSFFSGETKITIHSFDEIEKDSEIETFYCTGTMEEVSSLKNAINQTYATSYVHKGYSDGNDWMIWAIWSLIYCILLVLGWMTIQFDKKENFIKISMGASMKHIIIQNLVFDTMVYTVLICGLGIILNNFISLNYHSKALGLFFFTFMIVQGIMNIVGFGYDYKEIIYGANISMKTLGNCYALKVVSMMATIASIAVCIGLITYHYSYFRMYDEIDKYKEYSFLSYNIDTSDVEEDEETEQVYARKEAKLFYGMYGENKIALSVTNIINKDNIKYYLVSRNTLGIEDIISGEEDDDFQGAYILIPEEISGKEEIAEDAMEATKWDYEGFKKDFSYKIITYDQFELLYFDTENSELEFGFDREKNPVMILYNFDFESLEEGEAAVYLNGIQSDIMYRLDGMTAREIEQKFGLKNVKIISVTERCEQYKAMISRILLLNIIICIFMLLLEAVVIMTIIKLEYTVNAKELAVKKILGYSIINKNKFLFLTNFISALAALISVLIYFFMFSIAGIALIVLSSAILITAEVILIVYYIVKTEKVQTTKILKGGTL